MRRIVFYSWQSDLPNACNRGFIQNALELAAATIAADDSVAVEPVLDRDTQNTPGSPDIAATIFAKIVAASVFVADVSIVSRAENLRPCPNPNVLIELGYALKALGHERIIIVFNRAFGNIAELPFDLRARRVLSYEMPEVASERAPARKRLANDFDAALRVALPLVVETDLPDSVPAVAAIENAQANKVPVLRRNLDSILSKLIELAPTKHTEGGTVDQLIKGLADTQEIVAEFCKIAETIATMNDSDAALETCRWFGKVIEKYYPPATHRGQYHSGDYEYYKFLGHEMLVALVTPVLRNQRWELLSQVLEEPIPMRSVNGRRDGAAGWEEASEHLPYILHEGTKRERVSLHADLLKERHADNGGLASILPFEEFMDADLLLFLISQTRAASGLRIRSWRPWSCLYLRHVPGFVRNASRRKIAESLASLLSVDGIEGLKTALARFPPQLNKLFDYRWDSPIEIEDLQRIGTR
jgi:hypothetical protein